jgi:hypothetical protein
MEARWRPKHIFTHGAQGIYIVIQCREMGYSNEYEVKGVV